MEHLSVANSPLMFILVSVVIVAVSIQAVLFMRKAWKRGIEIGLDPKVMKKAMTNSAVFSIIPSLPIIIMLMVLTQNLGRFFPWLRLSVVGSAVYESISANMVATAAGLESIADPGFNIDVFGTAMWAMTLGIIGGIVFNILLMKSLDKYSKKAKAAKSTFVPLVSAAMFIGLLSLLAAPHVTDVGNWPRTLAFVAAAIASVLCQRISKAIKWSAIDEFSLPISLLIGMAAAIVFVQIAA